LDKALHDVLRVFLLFLLLFVTNDDMLFMVADDCSETSAQMQNSLYIEEQKRAKAKRG